MSFLKIVVISDTHEQHDKIKIPPCDILFHAGDISRFGSRSKIRPFAEWFSKQPARYKICIAGNHDIGLAKYSEWGPTTFGNLGISYLQESSVVVEGIKIYGMPWVPKFGPWAFMAERGSQALAEHIAKIPDNTDVLLCHGPPNGYVDANSFGYHVGCELLLDRIKKVKPKLVCCGHIHESYGVEYTDFGTTVVNAAQVNLLHKVVNRPIELIYNTEDEIR